MEFPNELWRIIKNYMLDKKYWKKKFEKNFDFIKAYHCWKEYLVFDTRVIYRGLSHDSNKLEKWRDKIYCLDVKGYRFESIHYIRK